MLLLRRKKSESSLTYNRLPGVLALGPPEIGTEALEAHSIIVVVSVLSQKSSLISRQSISTCRVLPCT